MVNFKYFTAGLISLAALAFLNPLKVSAQEVTWKLDNLTKIGDYKPAVLGNPTVAAGSTGGALFFNGVKDGVIVPKIPIEGWSHFTIEVLFKPDGDGPVAPRFIHFQDNLENRGTFEIRLNAKKQWYLDAFLKNGKTADKGLALNDSTLLHPADRWYWVAMVYDGKNMSSYVNGVKELGGIVNFPVMNSGNISFGVRLNKVSWFKGSIREIRFHPDVLSAASLQKVKE